MFAGRSIRYVPYPDSWHYVDGRHHVETSITRILTYCVPHHVEVRLGNADVFIVGPSVKRYVGRILDRDPILANQWGWRVTTKAMFKSIDDNLALDLLEHRGERINSL